MLETANMTECEWMVKNHPHKDSSIHCGNTDVLLNADCGGSVEIVIEFLNKFLSFYFQSVHDTLFEIRDAAWIWDI